MRLGSEYKNECIGVSYTKKCMYKLVVRELKQGAYVTL